MVSVNVAQLLLEPPGSVRKFDFHERFPDPADELHLQDLIAGHARLIRTSEGILVHTEYAVPVGLECARCLDPLQASVEGAFDEEFLPTTDIRTGLPLNLPYADDQPLINEHHEIDLDEVLRQNILTNLPLAPLCDLACPGLCETCGQRLDQSHTAHAGEPPPDESSPFARLAVLLNDGNSAEEER
jgi:uncharacterized protein